MNETTKNFWEVWNNLEPYQPPVIFWRLYYDDRGFPLFYTQEDKSGNYIDVTPMDCAISSMNVRVVDGKLVKIQPRTRVTKLVPAAAGTPCDPHDVTIITQGTAQHWKRKTNETD